MHRNQRIALHDPFLSGIGSCGKLGMGDGFPRTRNELCALGLKAQPFVKEVSNVISCRSNVLHSPTRRDATQPYVLVYPNQLLRLLDLDPIRLKFPQEIMPCGKTHNPNHNYHRLQVPPKPWLLNHHHHHQGGLLYRAPSLRRVFGVPLLAKSKRSG